MRPLLPAIALALTLIAPACRSLGDGPQEPAAVSLFNGQDLQAAENRVAGLPVAAAAMLREVLAPFGEAVESVQVTLCQPVSELGNREVELLAKEKRKPPSKKVQFFKRAQNIHILLGLRQKLKKI